MASLEGGSDVAGYPIVHTGMPEIYLTGNINLRETGRMKVSHSTGYNFHVGGNVRVVNATNASVWGTPTGNIHIDASTNKGVYINWHNGTSTSGDPLIVGNGNESSVFRVSRTGDLVLDNGTIITPISKNVGIQNSSSSHWVRPQDANGNMHLLATSGGIYMSTPYIQMEAPNGGGQYLGIDNTGINLTKGSFRVYGGEVFYHQTYGGGWYMTDSTWMRTYNGKNIYAGYGTIATDGSISAGTSGPVARLTSVVGTNGMPRPGINTSTAAAYIENNTDVNGQHGLVVATRWGGGGSTIFEAATFWGDSSQVYTPLLSVYGDKSVRISRKLVIPVGTDMYAT